MISKKVMDKKNIYLVYQPKIMEGKICAVEALMRVDKIIDIESYIKSFNDPISLDIQVLELVSDDLKHKRINCPVSINANYYSLVDDIYISKAIQLLKYTNTTLELTEHYEVKDLDCLKKSVKKLSKNGIYVSLDDFGKDFSRVNLINEIDFNEVKIDKSLIDSIENNYACYKHLAFLSQKLKALGINNIVYEGVENKTQLDLICLFEKQPIVQGYYYSKPISINELNNTGFEFICLIDSKGSKSIKDEIEELLYKIIISNEKDKLNKLIENTDFTGSFYNNDFRVTIENSKFLIYGEMNPLAHSIMKIMDSSPNLVVIRNCSGVTVYENKAHKKFLQFDTQGVDPESIIERIPDYKKCIIDDLELINSGNYFSINKEIFYEKEFRVIRQKSYHNGRCFIITTIYEEELGFNFHYDELTGCLGRSYLNKQSNNIRFKGNAIAFLDLNGFKAVNDTFGHYIGDSCLTDFVNLLKVHLRGAKEDDVIIRYGGDEFVVIFDSSDLDAINIRLSFVNSITKRFFEEKGIQLSFSFGVCLNEGDLLKTISNADQIMYANKSAQKKLGNLYEFVS
ncbi:TPA: GGDEF domain-containing protein [Vibrio harveyi]|nr:GGDEF domain-containing protein [Vibrio harveyi]